MDTERWQILLKAIDRGSLRAAAEEMGFTVSGISRSVATLEKELGFSLLYRAKSGVQPTEECRQLLPSVRELLFAQERLEQIAARCAARIAVRSLSARHTTAIMSGSPR